MIKTTPWPARTTVRASDKSPTSARIIARSTFPVENDLAASNAESTLTTLRRTGELVAVRRPAIDDII